MGRGGGGCLEVEANIHLCDQVLDTIYVGPVPEGRHMFVFQADALDHSKIPAKDIVGATVILVTCSYHGQVGGFWIYRSDPVIFGCMDPVSYM